MTVIADLCALEILDSRGWPTLSVTATLADGTQGSASVPSGASTGRFERPERRDGDMTRFHGRGVSKAAFIVTLSAAPRLRGLPAHRQAEVDAILRELDGRDVEGRLGSNGTLAISLAVARAAARAARLPLYAYLGGPAATRLPVPLMNVINGGRHADNGLAFQEFMIVPHGSGHFAEAVRWGAEVYHALADTLRDAGHRTAVGDEGGFAPPFGSAHEACDAIVAAIRRAGLRPGADVAIAIDPAATSFHEVGGYRLHASDTVCVDAAALIRSYEELIGAYPIVSLEDGLAESDHEGAAATVTALGDRVQLVGDDIFVTDPARIRTGALNREANAVLIKPNQVGTLTETLTAVAAAHEAGWATVVSHRSGETDDSFIADLVVATGSGQIKAGAPCRGERVAKYNRLLAIEQELGSMALFSSPFRNRFAAA